MLKFVAFTLIASAAIPAAAQITFDDSPPVSKPSQSDPNKKVCRNQDEIGSRLSSKKVCMTAREWKDLEEQTRASVERMQQNTGITPSN